MGNNLRVDAKFADAPGNQLGVLTSKIEDENGLVCCHDNQDGMAFVRARLRQRLQMPQMRRL